jgi:hypothetical protein
MLQLEAQAEEHTESSPSEPFSSLSDSFSRTDRYSQAGCLNMAELEGDKRLRSTRRTGPRRQGNRNGAKHCTDPGCNSQREHLQRQEPRLLEEWVDGRHRNGFDARIRRAGRRPAE